MEKKKETISKCFVVMFPFLLLALRLINVAHVNQNQHHYDFLELFRAQTSQTYIKIHAFD